MKRNSIIQFLRYCFVGGIATVVDGSILFVLEVCGMHYLLAAGIGFLGGLVCNFVLSKLFVFHQEKVTVNEKYEFLIFCLIGVVGLVLTLLLMQLFTEVLSIYFMISKGMTTLLVLIWNYEARKRIIYNASK